MWLYSEGNRVNLRPETARDILGEAGWADRDNDGLLEKEIDGVKHDLKFTLLANSNNPKKVPTARMIRDDLVGLGISVVLEELTWEGLLERVNKEFGTVVLGWSLANYLDFSFAFHTNQIEGAVISSPTVTRKWTASCSRTFGQERKQGRNKCKPAAVYS